MQNDSNLTLYKSVGILSPCALLQLLSEENLPLEHCCRMEFPGFPLSASRPVSMGETNQQIQCCATKVCLCCTVPMGQVT